MRIVGWYRRQSGARHAALWLGIAGLVVASFVAFGSWRGIIGPGGDETPSAGEGRLLLVSVRAPENGLPALALVHEGSTHDVVLLPSGTLVEVPGAGPRSLRATLADDGPEVVAVSVANVLGTGVPRTLTGGEADVAALADALGGVIVDVPEDIRVIEGGFERTIHTRGRQHMDGARFASFLLLTVPDENELERVARQDAAWRGLVQTMAGRDMQPRAAGALGRWKGVAAGEAARMLWSVAHDDRRAFHTLPVTRVGVADEDLYRLDATQASVVRAALRDVTPEPAGSARRVRLLVGADGPVGAAVAKLLVEDGYSIVLTGRASQPYDVTRVVMAERGDEVRRSADRLLHLLGTGRRGISERPTSLFDVTLVVGRDWAASNGFPQPTPRRR